jgi:hypothetical protein
MMDRLGISPIEYGIVPELVVCDSTTCQATVQYKQYQCVDVDVDVDVVDVVSI